MNSSLRRGVAKDAGTSDRRYPWLFRGRVVHQATYEMVKRLMLRTGSASGEECADTQARRLAARRLVWLVLDVDPA
jgi:hypothetical protein